MTFGSCKQSICKESSHDLSLICKGPDNLCVHQVLPRVDCRVLSLRSCLWGEELQAAHLWCLQKVKTSSSSFCESCVQKHAAFGRTRRDLFLAEDRWFRPGTDSLRVSAGKGRSWVGSGVSGFASVHEASARKGTFRGAGPDGGSDELGSSLRPQAAGKGWRILSGEGTCGLVCSRARGGRI